MQRISVPLAHLSNCAAYGAMPGGMPMGVLRRTDGSLQRTVANRVRSGGHGRTTILVSITGLVLGSLVAIAGPTAAAAKTSAIHGTTLGAAGASHVKTGDLTLAGQTPSPFSSAV